MLWDSRQWGALKLECFGLVCSNRKQNPLRIFYQLSNGLAAVKCIKLLEQFHISPLISIRLWWIPKTMLTETNQMYLVPCWNIFFLYGPKLNAFGSSLAARMTNIYAAYSLLSAEPHVCSWLWESDSFTMTEKSLKTETEAEYKYEQIFYLLFFIFIFLHWKKDKVKWK